MKDFLLPLLMLLFLTVHSCVSPRDSDKPIVIDQFELGLTLGMHKDVFGSMIDSLVHAGAIEISPIGDMTFVIDSSGLTDKRAHLYCKTLNDTLRQVKWVSFTKYPGALSADKASEYIERYGNVLPDIKGDALVWRWSTDRAELSVYSVVGSAQSVYKEVGFYENHASTQDYRYLSPSPR